MPVLHTDAATSIFYEGQLEAISTRVLTTKVRPTRAQEFMQLSDQNIPRYAASWLQLRAEEIGYSRWLAAGANDMPWADVKTTGTPHPVRKHGVGYRVTDDEAEEAQALGMNISDRRATAALRAAERFRDKVLIQGDASVGLEGFINNSNVPTTTDTSWAGTPKTTAEMLADLGQWLESARANHKDTVRPDTLVLPPAAFNHARVTKETGSDLTTLEFLLRSMGTSGITKITYLDELATAGVGSTTRAVLYWNDPEVLSGELAHFFEFGEPLRELQGVAVPGKEALGGCQVIFPPGMLYIDGV